MSSSYFISDLHLDPARPQAGRALKRFLQALISDSSDCAALYILGDLFDVWVGDDDDAELALATIQALRALTAAGIRLYLMQGNRDFLLDEGFCKATDATLLTDPYPMELYGRRTLLMHGDLLCTDDVDYQAFRAQVRQPHWREDILGRSLQQRRTLAAQLRTISHEAKSNKAEDIVDVNPAAVDEVMQHHDADLLIHGHTHRPGCYSAAAGSRWVLGDWEQQPNTLKVTSEEIMLIDII